LRQELALVTNYIEIERMRFVDRLGFAVHATHEVLDTAVPPLLLLPIVENAVRYAITPRTSAGRIDVEAVREKDTLVVRIKDEAHVQQPAHDRRGREQTRACRRQKLMYGGIGARTRQIDNPHVMKRHAGKKVVNPQWQPFELFCRDLKHWASFVVNECNC
jgi:LytS/YehU family sensor histidine kinase